MRSLAALSYGPLASGSFDKTVRVWDVGARACVASLEGHGGDVKALAALPDGRLASGSLYDPLIRVWTLTAPGTPEDAAAAAAEARGVVVAPGAEAAAPAAAGGGALKPRKRRQSGGSRNRRVTPIGKKIGGISIKKRTPKSKKEK